MKGSGGGGGRRRAVPKLEEKKEEDIRVGTVVRGKEGTESGSEGKCVKYVEHLYTKAHCSGSRKVAGTIK